MKRVGLMYRESLVTTLKQRLKDNKNFFLISYTDLKSPRISELRKDLKKAGADVFVSKNALARIALKEINQEPLAQRVEGQTAFVWSDEDSVTISKVLVKFSNECKTFTVKGGLLENRILEQKDVKQLSELPSREVLLGKLLGIIQAPVSQLLGALNGKSRELLSILKQLSEKKGGNQ